MTKRYVRSFTLVVAMTLIAATTGWFTAESQDHEYVAQAVFIVKKRSPDTEFVSHSKTIVAEQTARQLNKGPFSTGTWVVGSRYGQVAYRITATTAAAANKAALEVYQASPAQLFGTGVRPATMAADELGKASPTWKSSTKITAAAALSGAVFGVTVAIMLAFRPEPRHQPEHE